jgi:RNA-directed DNA polymerase
MNARRIACAGTLALMDAIVDGSNAQESVVLHFPGDDLFEPHRRRRGLPIGNLTSQFFANLYLDGFDHFVTEVLRAPYVRCVDDFALFHDDAAVLAQWRTRIVRYLEGRRVRLHPIQLFGSICHSGNSNCPDACTLVLSSSHRVASDTTFPENQAGG